MDSYQQVLPLLNTGSLQLLRSTCRAKAMCEPAFFSLVKTTALSYQRTLQIPLECSCKYFEEIKILSFDFAGHANREE